jgi:hypothetical protein
MSSIGGGESRGRADSQWRSIGCERAVESESGLREGVLNGVGAVLHLGGTSIDGGRWVISHQEPIRSMS